MKITKEKPVDVRDDIVLRLSELEATQLRKMAYNAECDFSDRLYSALINVIGEE